MSTEVFNYTSLIHNSVEVGASTENLVYPLAWLPAKMCTKLRDAHLDEALFSYIWMVM